jgi:hypothetical protein
MDEETNELPTRDNVIFGEIQVLLADKRTALASLRTGTPFSALPLSVLSVLIATSGLIWPAVARGARVADALQRSRPDSSLSIRQRLPGKAAFRRP